MFFGLGLPGSDHILFSALGRYTERETPALFQDRILFYFVGDLFIEIFSALE